jgi:chemotaxis protein methyltransferase CheR
MPAVTKLEIEDVETELFLEGIFRCYDFDFRQYAPASLKRRIRAWMRKEGIETISALQDKVLHDEAAMDRFSMAVTVNVTEMFRDPLFYRAFREKAVPLLPQRRPLRIWHAGCSSGEEVYSVAILLREKGLGDLYRTYATDMNDAVLKRAREGIFSLSLMRKYSQNYLDAGGQASLADYYTARYGNALFDASLRRNIVFAQHNLVSDGSFNEFDLIVCRNVLIYFNQTLKIHVLKLFCDSLSPAGLLALGAKESLGAVASAFEVLDAASKLYRLVR